MRSNGAQEELWEEPDVYSFLYLPLLMCGLSLCPCFPPFVTEHVIEFPLREVSQSHEADPYIAGCVRGHGVCEKQAVQHVTVEVRASIIRMEYSPRALQ
jgi:hypothetical protein